MAGGLLMCRLVQTPHNSPRLCALPLLVVAVVAVNVDVRRHIATGKLELAGAIRVTTALIGINRNSL
jgi:hypothetical protein